MRRRVVEMECYIDITMREERNGIEQELAVINFYYDGLIPLDITSHA